jgi:hypothetical protein
MQPSARNLCALDLGVSLLGACAAARTTTTLRELPLAASEAEAAPEGALPDLPLAGTAQAGNALHVVRFSEADRGEADRIARCLLRIAPRLARWGAFHWGVELRVYPTHAELEDAANQEDLPWLRAWAWGRSVALQSPRTWSEPIAVPDGEVEELLAHELTHALMYQLIEPHLASEDEPPLWFREGMASVTAGQGHRRWGPAELARFVAAHPGTDLLHPSAEVYRVEKEAVYGAAHRAFELLLELAGDGGVREILRRAGEGRTFDQAFAEATGRPLAAFEADSVRVGFASRSGAQGASGAGGP